MTGLSLSLPELILPCLALLVAGTVKGTIGLGLPTTALAIMTLATGPRQAISYILIPMIVSNAWQVYRSGDIIQAFFRYLPFSLALMVSVWLTISLTANVSEQVLLAVLGSAIVVFVVVSLTSWAPVIPDRLVTWAQIVMGLIAGIMGGLTSVWAPPMAMYLTARGVDKTEFVRASGLLIFLGSWPLGGGYVAQGLIDAKVLLVSSLLLIPTFLGYSLGEAVRNRIDQQSFRLVFLAFFFLMGLNMIRRALL